MFCPLLLTSPSQGRTFRTAESGGDLAGQISGGGFAAGGFLEEEEGGQGFSGDVVGAEDGDHLVGQVADFGGVAFFQVGDDEIEGGERGFVGVAVGEELLADGGEEVAGLFVIAEAGGDAAGDPVEAETVQGASLLGGQGLKVWQEVGGFGVAAHFGEVVEEVVTDAKVESRISDGIDEAVGFLQGVDDGFALLGQDEGSLDEAPTGEVGIAVLGWSVEEEIDGLVEELEGFGQAALRHPQGGLEVEEDGLIAEGVSDVRGAGFPPGVRHVEGCLGASEIALHFAGVAEGGAGRGCGVGRSILSSKGSSASPRPRGGSSPKW